MMARAHLVVSVCPLSAVDSLCGWVECLCAQTQATAPVEKIARNWAASKSKRALGWMDAA